MLALTATGSQLYPQIGYGADATRTRASAVGVPPLPPGANPYFSLYQVSMGASWQLDLFGRVRRLSEAAQAQVYASEQGQRGVCFRWCLAWLRATSCFGPWIDNWKLHGPRSAT